MKWRALLLLAGALTTTSTSASPVNPLEEEEDAYICKELPDDTLRPVTFFAAKVASKSSPSTDELFVRWPHESASSAAARFCREHKIGVNIPDGFESDHVTNADACVEIVSHELRPDVPPAPSNSWQAKLGSLYEEKKTQLTLSSQMAIATALRRYRAGALPLPPRLLQFGAGHDSVLQCAAATLGLASPGSAVFVEDNVEWTNVVRGELAAFLAANNLPPDSCRVVVAKAGTRRADWIDWLGRSEELADAYLSQIFQTTTPTTPREHTDTPPQMPYPPHQSSTSWW